MAILCKEIFQNPLEILLFISCWPDVKWSYLVAKGSGLWFSSYTYSSVIKKEAENETEYETIDLCHMVLTVKIGVKYTYGPSPRYSVLIRCPLLYFTLLVRKMRSVRIKMCIDTLPYFLSP